MRLRDLYATYRDRVHFVPIYIREAHPVDGWALTGGVWGLMIKLMRSKALTDLSDPRTLDERRAIAGRCEQTLAYGIPTYVDEMDDRVNRAYAARPTRLYLIGTDGRVAYAGGLGPFGFKPAELASAIQRYLDLGAVRREPGAP